MASYFHYCVDNISICAHAIGDNFCHISMTLGDHGTRIETWIFQLLPDLRI